MRLRQAFTPDAWEEYLDWQKTDRKRLKRLNRVIEDADRGPPNPLLARPARAR